MAKKQSGKGKRRVLKAVLRLPDLDQAKSAVLNSISSADAQRGYQHAIEEFVECEPPSTTGSVSNQRVEWSRSASEWPTIRSEFEEAIAGLGSAFPQTSHALVCRYNRR